MKIFFIMLSVNVLLSTCRPNNTSDVDNIAGYVIARETCYQDEPLNAWLLDCTVRALTPQLGDTLVIDNVQYTNVIRIRNLEPDLQQIGVAVSVYYSELSGKKVSGNCDVASPKVYALREIVAKIQALAR
jgi:hypothetical protein